ncbi:hypothetical protein BGZ61DRAFT_437390 [Ilyonectria robusta]|uniref:uncharacterized protein n=1 Tax=Ilyonectria robusta TaxID=1079257 RepID=UPI001E8E99EF|nr:uncharacterized protein BGZ61DRAFT_437390 [Ilyonectria robusta]KAH8736975.1 hypothetical protein BGZ61DRAFT_437390 [Ilyonectria robusta]
MFCTSWPIAFIYVTNTKSAHPIAQNGRSWQRESIFMPIWLKRHVGIHVHFV